MGGVLNDVKYMAGYVELSMLAKSLLEKQSREST